MAIDQLALPDGFDGYEYYDLGAKAKNINFDKTGTDLSSTNVQSAIVEVEGNVNTLDTNKVDKVAGKGLSTEDYTTAEKTKLGTVSENANHVDVTRYVTTGTKIATISCDGSDTDIYASGSGGSGGHTIIDNNGDALTQRDEMQFVGTYSEDDSTNEITKVNIVREMTKAEFDLLSDDEKAGIINVTDEAGPASIINGTFVDTDNIIIPLTEYKPSMTYTATEDCYIVLYTVFGSNTTIRINNEIVGNFDGSGNFGITNNFYLKKGQIISVTNASSSYKSYYIVYGIQQGSNQGAEIDDTTPSFNTVYSSAKVENLIASDIIFDGSITLNKWVEPLIIPNVDLNKYTFIYIEFNSTSSGNYINADWKFILTDNIPIGDITDGSWYIIDGGGSSLSCISKTDNNDLYILTSTNHQITINKIIGIK